MLKEKKVENPCPTAKEAAILMGLLADMHRIGLKSKYYMQLKQTEPVPSFILLLAPLNFLVSVVFLVSVSRLIKVTLGQGLAFFLHLYKSPCTLKVLHIIVETTDSYLSKHPII